MKVNLRKINFWALMAMPSAANRTVVRVKRYRGGRSVRTFLPWNDAH
jgi:hypothetical protein